jgi:hypothetical protein
VTLFAAGKAAAVCISVLNKSDHDFYLLDCEFRRRLQCTFLLQAALDLSALIWLRRCFDRETM